MAQSIADFTTLGGNSLWWGTVVTSSTGLKIAAAASAAVTAASGLYTSANAGATMVQHLNGFSFGSSSIPAPLVSSADGATLLVFHSNQGFSGSADSGSTWTTFGKTAGSGVMIGLACSSTGAKVIAATDAGLFTSINAGATWTVRNPNGTSFANIQWRGVASDVAGVKLVAANLDGSLWTSANSGVNWTQRIAAIGANYYDGLRWNLNAISSSDDGAVLIASGSLMVSGQYMSRVYTSTNSGVSWVMRQQSTLFDGTTGNNFLHPRVSGDGTKMVFANTAPLSQNLSISQNNGASWTEIFRTSQVWTSLAVSRTGDYVYGTSDFEFTRSLLRSTDLFAGRTASIEMMVGYDTISAAFVGSSPVIAAYVGTSPLLNSGTPPVVVVPPTTGTTGRLTLTTNKLTSVASATSGGIPVGSTSAAAGVGVTLTSTVSKRAKTTGAAGASVALTATASTVSAGRIYPVHTSIVSTTFWVGELYNASLADGSQICSTYDAQWAFHHTGANLGVTPGSAAGCAGSVWGGCDGVSSGTTYATFTCDTQARTAANGYMPTSQPLPLENPFYMDLPYDDLNDPIAFAERGTVIPWANDVGYAGQANNENFSYMKNRWVKLTLGANTCYAQIEDAGPSSGSAYHDKNYVFGSTNARPLNTQWDGAGMDVSPAVNSYLGFTALNDTQAGISWQFVEFSNVPAGPWKTVITTSGVTL